MARTVSWLPRIDSIARTVSGSARSHYGRRDLEKLFEVQSRTAQSLLGLLPSYQMGSTLLVPREDLLEFLQVLAESEDSTATLAKLQEKGRPPRVRTSLKTFNRTHYSSGLEQFPANIQLSRGELRVVFQTMEEFAQAMMLIADEMQNNFERFVKLYEPEAPPPSNAEEQRLANEKADAAYIAAFIAEFDKAKEQESQAKSNSD